METITMTSSGNISAGGESCRGVKIIEAEKRTEDNKKGNTEEKIMLKEKQARWVIVKAARRKKNEKETRRKRLRETERREMKNDEQTKRRSGSIRRNGETSEGAKTLEKRRENRNAKGALMV